MKKNIFGDDSSESEFESISEIKNNRSKSEEQPVNLEKIESISEFKNIRTKSEEPVNFKKIESQKKTSKNQKKSEKNNSDREEKKKSINEKKKSMNEKKKDLNNSSEKSENFFNFEKHDSSQNKINDPNDSDKLDYFSSSNQKSIDNDSSSQTLSEEIFEDVKKRSKSSSKNKINYFIEMMNLFINKNIDCWESEKTQKKFRSLIIDNIPKIREKIKDPNKPKKIRSAYIFFSIDKRNEIKTKYPNLKPQEIMKKIGESWKKLSLEKKEKYEKQKEIDKERFNSDMKKYEKPKKPLNAYNLFFSEQYPKINCPQKEKFKIISEQWKNISQTEKEFFIQKADKEKNLYNIQMTTFLNK